MRWGSRPGNGLQTSWKVVAVVGLVGRFCAFQREREQTGAGKARVGRARTQACVEAVEASVGACSGAK